MQDYRSVVIYVLFKPAVASAVELARGVTVVFKQENFIATDSLVEEYDSDYERCI
jgi:hypothetical protein